MSTSLRKNHIFIQNCFINELFQLIQKLPITCSFGKNHMAFIKNVSLSFCVSGIFHYCCKLKILKALSTLNLVLIHGLMCVLRPHWMISLTYKISVEFNQKWKKKPFIDYQNSRFIYLSFQVSIFQLCKVCFGYNSTYLAITIISQASSISNSMLSTQSFFFCHHSKKM